MAEAELRRPRVLVVGGSGYLGQHLLAAFTAPTEHYAVAFTHHSAAPPARLLAAIPSAVPFRVDLRSGEGLDLVSASFGQPDIIVNCAAISIPRACELDPAAAMAINVPTSLVNWLLNSNDGDAPLLIHLSTDQVYEGCKSFYKEEDEAVPVNTYGKSKLAAEQLVMEKYRNYAILRSSIIYGPQTIAPVAKSLPIQWIDSVLSQGGQIDFFEDEFRCPVYVKDVVDVVLAVAKQWAADHKTVQLLLNVGGPDRVSRVQMGETVASVRGYDLSLVKSVSAASVKRGVISPADISMDIGRLINTLGIKLTTFRDGVESTLKPEA